MPAFKKRIEVHLGNVGGAAGEKKANKTGELAGKNPSVFFVGVDKTPFRPHSVLRNWKQLAVDFEEGLKRFKPNTIHKIPSEIALGYYDRHGMLGGFGTQAYTSRVVALAYEKLVGGGQISVIVDDAMRQHSGKTAKQIIDAALSGCGFSRIEQRIVTPAEFGGLDYWAEWIYNKAPKSNIWQITATK